MTTTRIDPATAVIAPSTEVGPTTGVLLSCGILSSLVYATATVIGGLRWNAYAWRSQTVSELSAIGAPSRPLMIALFTAYALLAIAFGVGVRRVARNDRPLRITALLLLLYGVVCLVGPVVPMHQRDAIVAGAASLSDTMHKVTTIVDVLLILAIIARAARSFGTWFRDYSAATLAILLAAGLRTMPDVARIEANLPTPWIGLTERICIGSFLLWIVVLSVVLRSRDAADA